MLIRSDFCPLTDCNNCPWVAVETEEERRARLENDASTKRLRLAVEMDEERKARLERW